MCCGPLVQCISAVADGLSWTHVMAAETLQAVGGVDLSYSSGIH